MKSHIHAGKFKLRGKKTKLLRCGCCEVADLREKYAVPWCPEPSARPQC